MSTSTLTKQPQPAPRMTGRRSVIGIFRQYTFAFALVLCIILVAASLVIQPNFGLNQQLASFAPLAIAAMASTPSIVSGRGGLDLSIGPLMTLSSIVFVGYLAPAGLGGIEALLVCMALGAFVGAVNGFLIVRLHLQPVVVTLSMFFIVTGINLRLAPGPVTLGESWVRQFALTFFGIPGGIVGVAIPVIIWLILIRTAFGRNLYAVGGNDATAFSAGVKVGLIRVLAFAIGGLFAGMGGLVLAGLVSSADASSSGVYTLTAIAAVALGGTSLLGGRGGLIGALIGAAVIYLVQNLLAVSNVQQAWLPAVYGAMLIISVVIGAMLATKPKESR